MRDAQRGRAKGLLGREFTKRCVVLVGEGGEEIGDRAPSPYGEKKKDRTGRTLLRLSSVQEGYKTYLMFSQQGNSA